MRHLNKKQKIGVVALLLALPLIISGCYFYINAMHLEQEDENGDMVMYINAGDTVTWVFDCEIYNQSASDEYLIASILLPTSWNGASNAKMVYVEDHYEPDLTQSMTVIEDSESPATYSGMTWGDAMMSKYGVGYNVLTDMEWVTFKTPTYSGDIDVATYTVIITFTCPAGSNNLKFKPAFYINCKSNGLGSDSDYFDIAYGDCFEVINGKGATTDFCNNHYYSITPLAVTQDDFITFTFQGGIYDNDLAECDSVYLVGYVETESGNVYEMLERNDETLMTESSSQTFEKTIWPADYFNVEDGETVSCIYYYFCNIDGTMYISSTEDDRDIGDGIDEDQEGVLEYFSFELMCD